LQVGTNLYCEPGVRLIDGDGYYCRDLDSVRWHLVAKAAGIELRAQVNRAIASGMRPSHIDPHMVVAMFPELLDAHVWLGREYGMCLVLPRSINWAPDHAAYQATLRTLDVQGAPVVDYCRRTLPVMRDELAHG
jgi:chitin disaccharide deacetylase